MLASTQFDTVSLYRTTDAGVTWSSYQNGFGGAFSETVLAIERHPHQPNILFATGATVVAKSLDRGRSWQISHGNWGGLATGVNFITIDANDSKIIWVGGQNSIEEAFLWKSEDAGATWREWPRIVDDVSTGKTVVIHPHDSKTVYAGLESYILRTTDGGETWKEIFAEDGRFFFGIAINPVRPGRIYTASWFKTSDPQPLIVYISDDAGENWREVHEKTAQFGGVWDLLHVNEGMIDKLYLGLNKGGVYEFVTEVTTEVDDDPAIVSTFKLEQNYPNPFNPETVISFSLPRAGLATLKIYDALGREVATLTNHMMAAGEHQIRWRSSGLASGVYFYRLQAGNFSAVKKMLMLQ
ncbi:T9SS C-terminal target domain-containing protein [candidate division KSB1 bacterium]|nr:MAG: T9SS C-terminal target domain-containing protein [candidate division KSB1 bacterium]MBC6950366.1 T9SS C-terminal target domain-containing protein [candidate division KSB1 bacterium]MCE7944946.1 T9SS C-terminal target domain-containing protein [Chlorobi bacterium CHB1]MDL1877758.1 T9SS type A sorting domain-containing protein [Cytophagia bacterium CHB2]